MKKENSKNLILRGLGIDSKPVVKKTFVKKVGEKLNILKRNIKKNKQSSIIEKVFIATVVVSISVLIYSIISTGAGGYVVDTFGIIPSIVFWIYLSFYLVWLFTRSHQSIKSVVNRLGLLMGMVITLSGTVVTLTGEFSAGGYVGKLLVYPFVDLFQSNIAIVVLGMIYSIASVILYLSLIPITAALFYDVVYFYKVYTTAKDENEDLTPAETVKKENTVDGNYLTDLLADFGVNDIEAVSEQEGKKLTEYVLKLPRGMKPSRIVSEQESLSNSLGVNNITVLPVIEGMRRGVGVQIPKLASDREIVDYSVIKGTDYFQNNDMTLPMVLGETVQGEPVIIDLVKIKHSIVSGTTGSGKSKLVEVMLLSLLQKVSPDLLELIIIDPKLLEMTSFSSVPHLRGDIVTDPIESQDVLSVLCDEMDERYGFIADYARETGRPIKNIASYNNAIEGDEERSVMKYIVVDIDEFADLIMNPNTDSKIVEESVVRLCQKGRAAGIHILLATQRPTVDVVTGLIKANMPCKIGLKTGSSIDSRVILDTAGAEKLLGDGDMLVLNDCFGSTPLRVHGAYIDDDELVNELNQV